MIVELATYRVKAGRRAEFIQFFETEAVPVMRAHGIRVLGPVVDLENPNRFMWLRSFPSDEERIRRKKAFHDSDAWTGKLGPVAMPMLESWDFGIFETSEGYSQDKLGPSD
jgi:hypothetical protein